MTDPITPTQADIRRATEWLDVPADTPARRSERDRLAVKFARHRIAAEERGARWGIEAGAGEATEYATFHNKHDDGLSGFDHMALGATEVAETIRALDPKTICDSARETDRDPA